MALRPTWLRNVKENGNDLECDPRVGGQWIQVWGPSRDEIFREVCVFSVVDRPHQLSMASHMSTPDGQEFDTLVDIQLETVGQDKTQITIVHSEIPSAELRDFLATAAWQGFFDRLAWYFENSA